MRSSPEKVLALGLGNCRRFVYMENVKAILSKQENMQEIMWYILKARWCKYFAAAVQNSFYLLEK